MLFSGVGVDRCLRLFLLFGVSGASLFPDFSSPCPVFFPLFFTIDIFQVCWGILALLFGAGPLVLVLVLVLMQRCCSSGVLCDLVGPFLDFLPAIEFRCDDFPFSSCAIDWVVWLYIFCLVVGCLQGLGRKLAVFSAIDDFLLLLASVGFHCVVYYLVFSTLIDNSSYDSPKKSGDPLSNRALSIDVVSKRWLFNYMF